MTTEAEAGQPTAYPPNIIRIEHYQEEDAQSPTAWARFAGRWTRFRADGEVNQYNTIVVDSVSSMELVARKYHQYVLNPSSRDPRQWWNGATDALEEMLWINLGALRKHVVVVAHVDEKKNDVSGEIVWNPAAPGRLSKKLPAGYAELWHAYVQRKGTEREYVIQTSPDGRYHASTQADLASEIVIPRGTGVEDVVGNDNGPQHVILYGDSGTGKSTLASGGQLPMLVWMFDPVGKDTPYRKRGKVIDSFDEEAAWDASGQPIAWTHVEVVEVAGG